MVRVGGGRLAGQAVVLAPGRSPPKSRCTARCRGYSAGAGWWSRSGWSRRARDGRGRSRSGRRCGRSRCTRTRVPPCRIMSLSGQDALPGASRTCRKSVYGSSSCVSRSQTTPGQLDPAPVVPALDRRPDPRPRRGARVPGQLLAVGRVLRDCRRAGDLTRLVALAGELVQRRAELGGERVQGSHGRVRLAPLHLGDEGRGTPILRAISRSEMPRAVRASRSRRPIWSGAAFSFAGRWPCSPDVGSVILRASSL